ncbi:MAG: alternate F1F0 ATPase, F1 subunit alpha [Candidatus Omnitrophica bacterium]|nr:alternate F1F0 ATPase, F1 subunit alpha [Candidatus Omnitrophota bacterium]
MGGSTYPKELRRVLDEFGSAWEQVRDTGGPRPAWREVGRVRFVSRSIARVQGLPQARLRELIRFPGRVMGMAFNLSPEEISVVLLDKSAGIGTGDEVVRTGRILDIPVGESLRGRVVDPLCRPLDDQGPVRASARLPVERDAPGIMDRAPVNVPLQTGIQVIDALIPIGRGQRELILGDRQTGKSAIAVDTIINQRDKDVVCVYCLIGKEAAAVARMVSDLRRNHALEYTVVVAATGDDTAGMNYVAPYTAMTIGEYFMEQGKDALVVFDDLTRHARAYRELSLLLRRPPAREAYPGDIFYIHSRLLERATHLHEKHGGGSLSAFPIVETQAQNLSAYIPTNLISITDGQIYLSPKLFQQGVMPAADVGTSVSRVGGKTQLAAYRAVAGDLRLSYSQFEELEAFSRFGTRLDPETRKKLQRGYRIREVLKQPQYQPLPVPEQIAVLLAVTEGVLDQIPVPRVQEAKKRIRSSVARDHEGLGKKILRGEKLTGEDIQRILETARGSVQELREAADDEESEDEQ